MTPHPTLNAQRRELFLVFLVYIDIKKQHLLYTEIDTVHVDFAARGIFFN